MTLMTLVLCIGVAALYFIRLHISHKEHSEGQMERKKYRNLLIRKGISYALLIILCSMVFFHKINNPVNA